MEYTVVITKQPDAPWSAVVPAFPNCTVEADSREAVVALIKDRVAQCHFEVLKIDLPDVVTATTSNGTAKPERKRTLRDFAGIFRDDPMWGAIFDEIEREREQHRISE